ncbi:unnamed protein product, partial [Didymodactylos carnosus]
RLAESLKNSMTDLIVPNMLRMWDNEQESTRARLSACELQCMYSASTHDCLIMAWHPLRMPAMLGAPSYACPEKFEHDKEVNIRYSNRA